MRTRYSMQRPVTLVALLSLTLAACERDPVMAPEADASHHAGAARSGRDGPALAEVNRQLVELRQATARFHDLDTAGAAGYVAAITPCWESRTRGGMGYHYADPDLLFDQATVNLLEPEALMYEPGPGGQMTLVGMEYIVFIDQWEAVHGVGADPPALLGQSFHPHSALPIYKLHIWLWRDNPSGVFADWNPKVSCRHAAEREYFP
jgi:hypothetical protein